MSAYAMATVAQVEARNGANLSALEAEMVAIADEADALLEAYASRIADDLLEAYANRIPEKVGPVRYGETVANVVKSKEGRLYAKVWNGKSWEYGYGVIYKLREADRLSLEEAKAFGHETGQCCVCSRTLTNATSVALGIGPICGGRI